MIAIGRLLTLCLCLTFFFAESSFSQKAFKQYTDGAGRFTFEYPSTMTVKNQGPDEVKIYHPAATLRISAFVQDRPKKSPPKAEAVADLFEKLKQEMKDCTVIEQGKLAGLDGAQGYNIYSFRDHRGMELVQLVQYFIAEDRVLQMIISDRTEGFKNLEKVIRKIHNSLKILNPKLK
ncbi:MAG: hypothetical protein HY912_14315 [Desulfomonile tiedjei]|uniref:DUF1795 domain-containing protein n=1 Tax=Desulfomonile tiedjei TaxID=2358 RepID=A0A9D6V642_9BACT|nr:hypothetical protein [Desulfomonile tiedjei]